MMRAWSATATVSNTEEEISAIQPPRIMLYSVPLVTTWVFDDTHRILFDAGDGVTAMLDARIHRIRLVALTHAHRDHCAGLLQLLNLTGSSGEQSVVYPAGSGALKALSGFLCSFDARTTGKTTWVPMDADIVHPIEPARHYVRSFPTHHYEPTAPPRTMSLGYQIVRSVDKLRPELVGLPREELDRIRLRDGRQAITQTVEDILLSVTGDTIPIDPALVRGSRALLHECTFLDEEETRDMVNRGHPHSSLEDALLTAREAEVEHLGLYHISRRYEDGRILSTVRDACARLRIPCRVSVALPGRLYDDLFSHTIWEGTDEP